MTREERKRARRIAIVSWLLFAAWLVGLAGVLRTCASAAYEGAEDPDKLTEVLALIGACTVSAGVMRVLAKMERG